MPAPMVVRDVPTTTSPACMVVGWPVLCERRMAAAASPLARAVTSVMARLTGFPALAVRRPAACRIAAFGNASPGATGTFV